VDAAEEEDKEEEEKEEEGAKERGSKFMCQYIVVSCPIVKRR
jgi:hypothetical protein